jgi:hypothetical protein
VRTWYHHCKFQPTEVNFDEEAVGQNWRGRGDFVVLVSRGFGSSIPSLVPLSTYNIFWSTLIGSNFKKKHVELFFHFYLS